VGWKCVSGHAVRFYFVLAYDGMTSFGSFSNQFKKDFIAKASETQIL
jgi:hypothetical protein